MVQPCPECHQTRRHKLSCDAPNRARHNYGHTSRSADVSGGTDLAVYCSPVQDNNTGCGDTTGTSGGDTGTCGGE